MDKKLLLQMQVAAILDEIERVSNDYIQMNSEENITNDAIMLVAQILGEIDKETNKEAYELLEQYLAEGKTLDEIADLSLEKVEEKLNSLAPINRVKKEDLN